MKQLSEIMSSTKAEQNALKAETAKLVTKWGKTGLLDEIKSEYERHGMAILLENQTKQLIMESSRTGTAAGSEEWSGVALPLVRRIFSEIAAKDFVSVQPMNLPSGLVFFIDFKYGTAQPGFATSYTDARREENSVFGVTSQPGNPTGGLYGAGKFGYSINEVTTSGLTINTVPNATKFATASAGLADYNYDTEFSSSIVNPAQIFTVTVHKNALSNNPSGTTFDKEGIRAFKIASVGSQIKSYYPAFTKIDSTDTYVTFLVSGSALAGATVKVTYHNQPTDVTRGDFEYLGPNQTNNPLDIPEINVEMRSEPIVAKSRKLKAIWTPEFAQDLNAYHAVDAENELTSMLSEYISMEIDLEILDMLIQNAVTVDYWSTTIGRIFNSGTNNFENDTTLAGQAWTNMTWYQTLGQKIQKVSNSIHQKTMRGGANFVVVSPKVATILESIPGYAADTDGTGWGTNGFAMGVQKVGMLNSRFQVYKNPYMIENVILTGFRGSQFLETGAVYAPYIPLIMTPLVYDPTDFTPRKGVMTRYAKQITRPEFYGKIYVEGLHKL